MKKLRTILAMLLLLSSLAFLFACNGDEPSGDHGGDGNGSENNGGNGAPDAPNSLNQYGDNIVDYDSLFGGAAQ